MICHIIEIHIVVKLIFGEKGVVLTPQAF